MDARQIERIKKKMVVKVDDQPCILEDLSKIGMQLIVPSLLKGREILVSFQMDTLLLEMECRVCWIRKELNIYRQPQYRVGVHIPDPSENYIRLVENLAPPLTEGV